MLKSLNVVRFLCIVTWIYCIKIEELFAECSGSALIEMHSSCVFKVR